MSLCYFLIATPVFFTNFLGLPLVSAQEDSPPTHPPYLVAIEATINDFQGDDYEHAEYDEHHGAKIISGYVCSGAIISPFWVVSSGACVIHTEQHVISYIAVAGVHHLESTNISRQEVGIKPYSNPGYNPWNEFSPSDVALFLVETPWQFTMYVRPVRLPGRETVPTGTAQLSGWGPRVLNETTVSITMIDTTECARIIDTLAPQNLTRITNASHFCSSGNEACFFHRGSPVVQNETLVGLATWNAPELKISCATPGLPSIFTRISSFLDFFEDVATDLIWPCRCPRVEQ